jgi:hypothetical protein
MAAKSRRSARIGILGGLLAGCLGLLAAPATAAPTLAMSEPTAGATTNATPTFSGTSSDALDPVKVLIFNGGTEPFRTLEAMPAASWSAQVPALEALPAGGYTAKAEQKELLGLLETTTTETVAFTVNTGPPLVTLVGPPSPSKNTTPSFSGTASEETEVVVRVFEGGTEKAKATTTASGGKWSTSTLSPALPAGKHTFTAQATEKSGLGNSEGESNVVTFEVNTELPKVTLVGPPTPSNNTTPSFSGTASEETEVVVHVFEGLTEVASASTIASGGKWSTSTLTPALPPGKHTFTAQATEKSGLGNAEGESNTVTFQVNTGTPVVTLVGPPTPSKNTTPSFSGTASEETEVAVHVFEGPTEVASAITIASGGKWSTSTLSPALPTGKRTFTARATEVSGVGNGMGTSSTVTFEVNTEAPAVTLVGPPTPAKNTTPSFSGEASENTEVVVRVFEGVTEKAKATTTASGGKWSTSTLSPALPQGKHTFTAQATEKSGLGNGEGESNIVTFEVNTEEPAVTLVGPPTPSNNTTPSFSGTASESTEVVVRVFEGGTEKAKATTTASGGKWSTSTLSPALPQGKHTFTAQATEKSGLGNSEGESNVVTFEVNTEVPKVTLVGPPTPSSSTTPSFSGTTSENAEVVVHVFEGATERAQATTTASGGKWSTSTLSAVLPSGNHTFTAQASEVSGLGNGIGTSNTVTFEVNTEAPVVTLAQPSTPSKNTTPSFSGTASENTEVVVHVFEGTTEKAQATTTASGSKWSTSALSPALPPGKHTFTAYAIEVSGLGNGIGTSSTVTFEVNTNSPVVALIGGPSSPTSSTTPSFSGTASEDTEVVVHVLQGNSEVASAKAVASSGVWETTTLSKSLQAGKHTFSAYATETSGLGNPPGTSNKVTFEVNTEAPKVTLVGPPTPSNNTNPSFSGTASEETEVVVHIFEAGIEKAQATTKASGGTWSTSTLSASLPPGRHTFTARATEKSGLGNAEGESNTVTFEVNTESPKVTLVGPPALSKNTTPSFSGTAGENTEVVVHIFEGATEKAQASTTASGGKWSTSTLSATLPAGKHTFTALATEKSGLGNPEGESNTVTFEVNTEAPVVTINQPPTPTNNTTPSFAGTASENTEIVVHVFEGSTLVAQAKATASGGKWSTNTLSKALPPGKRTFTAQATEKSGLGNGEGESSIVTFEVNTEGPSVTLAQPPTPSNNTNPSFSGTASEETEVVVHVFEGTTEKAQATTTASAGKWSTSTLSAALPPGRHTFTALATEVSGLGNGVGTSNTVTFEVNTEAPKVTISQPATPTNNTSPTFSGTASENTEVVVHVLEGSTPVAQATTTASGGKWSTTTLSSALPAGKRTFTAYAVGKSGLGNAEGKSGEVSFAVNTEPPSVSLVGPSAPSKNLTPSFSGEASEAGEVVVHILQAGKQVGTAAATVKAGKWSAVSSPLPEGKNTFTAYATEKSALGNPDGKSGEVSFEVNTLPPVVTVTGPALSNNRTPLFGGEASEAGEVVVHILLAGKQVGTATGTVKEGKWSATASAPLPEGKNKFTAFATEKSALGNGEGKTGEVSFEVNTLPPVVTLTGPVALSNNRSPVFSGEGPREASEAGEVVVHILLAGKQVGTATGTVKEGKWSATASAPLPEGKNKFTAFATEKSGLGNTEGKSGEVSFEVNTLPPLLTLTGPALSKNTTPSFSGEGPLEQSEAGEVVVHILLAGKQVGTATGTVKEGKWSATASAPLPEGKNKFTAFATEKSGLGNPEGKTAEVSFEVNTLPPEVTLEPLAGVSKEKNPSFSGAASESSPVTVEVFKGAKAEGKPFTTIISGKVSGGRWSAGPLPTALEDGEYAARASEESSLGNPIGYSSVSTFVVNTKAPTVKINAPVSPSNNRSPSFSGTISGGREVVTVFVHEGSTREGSIVSQFTAPISGGTWKSLPVPQPLPSGKHVFTVVATAPSAIAGNPNGESAPATFIVNTEAPAVTLAQPTALSNNPTPSFSGTASETGLVVVSVYRGAAAAGTPVTTGEGTVAEGRWASKPLSKRLEDGQYTVIATEKSAIGNEPGSSAPVTFTLDTKPPIVTLKGVPSPSSDRVPSFSGTASDVGAVTITIYHGASSKGTAVASVEAEVSGGEWYSPPVSTLEWGEYTAVATEPSSIGNENGYSAPITFVVEKIPPVVVTEAATEISETSAAVFAAVNPVGGPVSACNFEVISPSYGYQRTVACGLVSGSTVFPKGATGFVPVFIRIYGLRPSTTYQYRTIAVGEGGTGTGSYKTLTTEASSAPAAKQAPSPPVSTGGVGVLSFYATLLTPAGKTARIGAILKSGYFKQRFKAPKAGSAVIKWYYLPPGAKLTVARRAKKAAPAPVLVAVGSVTLHAAGTGTVKLRLTGVGRALLGRSKRVRLTATCTFTAVGGVATTTSGTFQLLR